MYLLYYVAVTLTRPNLKWKPNCKNKFNQKYTSNLHLLTSMYLTSKILTLHSDRT